ncbi:response regulator [Acinetobacter rudis]|uniref:response regulator n=1 Tax=Acinetobacter rudis TaxID=632955 RepID=UPI00280D952F|nr:response regulator [Acinetobacter rudis]MDQ8953804.1 response regulator [Acinetobacter rudis]
MARILIVEDSQTEMFRFREILLKHGYEVLEANNGAEGAAMAQAELPDLILMDVVMPGVNGFQATRHICRTESTRDIPIVMLSSKDQDTDRAWGMRQGAKAYLIKPIEEVELVSVIEQLLQQAVQHSPE